MINRIYQVLINFNSNNNKLKLDHDWLFLDKCVIPHNC